MDDCWVYWFASSSLLSVSARTRAHANGMNCIVLFWGLSLMLVSELSPWLCRAAFMNMGAFFISGNHQGSSIPTASRLLCDRWTLAFHSRPPWCRGQLSGSREAAVALATPKLLPLAAWPAELQCPHLKSQILLSNELEVKLHHPLWLTCSGWTLASLVSYKMSMRNKWYMGCKYWTIYYGWPLSDAVFIVFY